MAKEKTCKACKSIYVGADKLGADKIPWIGSLFVGGIPKGDAGTPGTTDSGIKKEKTTPPTTKKEDGSTPTTQPSEEPSGRGRQRHLA